MQRDSQQSLSPINRQNVQSLQGSSQIQQQHPYNQYFTKRKDKQLVGKTSDDKFNSAQSLHNQSLGLTSVIDPSQEFQALVSQASSQIQKKVVNNMNYSNNTSQTLTKKKISYGKNETHEIKIHYAKKYLKNSSLTVDPQKSERAQQQSFNGIQLSQRNQLGVIGVAHQHQTQQSTQNTINLRKLGSKKVFTNNVNISNISTNPSSSQVPVRNQKSVMENQSRQQHLLVLNQRTHENNSVTVIGQSRPSNASNSKIETIKNIYSQIQPINISENQLTLNINSQYSNLPQKQKKGRNFGVNKSSGISTYSHQSRDGGNIHSQKPMKHSSYSNIGNGMRSNKNKDNGGQNPKTQFGIKYSNSKKQQSIPQELEIRGLGNLGQNMKLQNQGIQSSQSTDQIIGQPNTNDLIKFFGLMQQRQKMEDQDDGQKQTLDQETGLIVQADSVLKQSPAGKSPQMDIMSVEGKQSGQPSSAGINYFQSQGKILKQLRSQQKNRSGSQNANSAARIMRCPRQLEPIEVRQRALPELPSSQTRSEPQTIILQSRTALAHISQSATKDALYVEQTQAMQSQKVTMTNHSMGSKIQRKNFARNLQNLGKTKNNDASNAMSLNEMYTGDQEVFTAPLDQRSLNTNFNDKNIQKIHPNTGKGQGKIPLTQQIKSIDQWPASKTKANESSPLITPGEVTYASIEPIQRDGQSLNGSTGQRHEIYNNQRSYQKVHLAPITRGQQGASPNTASATGVQQRSHLNYIRDNESRNSGMMQYKLPSQQCQSEIFPINKYNYHRSQDRDQENNISGYDGQPRVFNLNSNFEDSFEVFHEKSQQDFKNGGNGLDPNIDLEMNHIPSVHKITAIRNQKSQGTYRHNHKKISGVRGMYTRNIPTQHEIQRKQTEKLSENNFGGYEIMAGMSSGNQDQNPSQGNLVQFMINENTGNYCSQSEAYDKHSLSNINDINSQINDNVQPPVLNPQLNQVNQVSHLSQKSEQKSLLPKNQSYLSKRDTISLDDQPHPFNGPKLHLFRKGQSKSSQSKLRKIKTSEQNQRLIELNSQAGYSQNQTKMNQNSKSYLSEGGGVQSVNILPKLNKNKEGFLNIQDILDANHLTQIQKGGSQMNALRVYADVNSQGNISQISNELGKNRTIQNSGDKNGPNETNDHECRSQILLQQQYTDQQSLNDHDYSRITNSDLTGYDQGIIPFQSQGGTIQHNTIYSKGGYHENSQERLRDQRENSHERPKGKLILPNLASSNSSQNVLYNNRGLNAHINGSIQDDISQLQKIENQKLLDNSKSEKQLQRLDFKYKNQNSMRPNTTNPSYIVQEGIQNNEAMQAKEKIQNQLKPQRIQGNSSSNGGSQFHHPKVGIGSRHPDVFKKSQESSSKNLSRQIVSSKLLNESQTIKNLIENGADDLNSISSPIPMVTQNRHSKQTLAKFNSQNAAESPLELLVNSSEQSLMNQSRLSSSRKTGQFEMNNQNLEEFQNQKFEMEEFRKYEEQVSGLKNESMAKKMQINSQKQQVKKEEEQKIEQITLNDFKIGVQSQGNNIRQSQSKNIKSNLINQNQNKLVRMDQLMEERHQDPNQSFSESVQKQNSIKIVNKKQRMSTHIYQEGTLGTHQVKQQIKEAKEYCSDEEVKIQNEVNTNVYRSPRNTTDKNKTNYKNVSNPQIQFKSSQEVSSGIKQYTDQEYTNLQYQIPVNIKENTKFALTQQKMSKPYPSHDKNALYSETVTSNENTAPIPSGQPKPTVSSVAQTPCFAETPNTTDQFKGYKIDPQDNSKHFMEASNSNFNVKLNISQSILQNQNNQLTEESP